MCQILKGKKKNKVGDGADYSQGIAVHAGIRPDLPLDQQDPIDNLEMRSLMGHFIMKRQQIQLYLIVKVGRKFIIRKMVNTRLIILYTMVMMLVED